ncbi:MAG: hypothetical protein M3N93_09035 [Acidobacteriota bacterium]|nr:hypothetical protein [Acidobacteriota bacterium]
MATLATLLRDNRGRRNSRSGIADLAAAERFDVVRPESARVQADPWLLRGLPADGIYFYSKKIDNSRVVRQADPEARGECWSAVGAAGVLLMLGASIIAPHVGSVLAGYKLESLKTERQALLDQRRALDVKEAGLLSPERLNDLARARSLASPGSDQVIHLDTPAAEGSLAKIQTPSSSALSAQ